MRTRSILILVCLAAHGQTNNPFAGDPKAIETGSGFFQRQCVSCHGRNAHGGRAPDLISGARRAGDQDSDLFRAISEGIAGTEMSSYASRLGADNIWRVIAYLRSLTPSEPPPKGDAARGEALFWGKGGCGNCHAAGSRGNRLGPDLSRVGRQRSVSYLRQSLVDPSSDIVANYGGVAVVTRDGRTIRGLERALDDFSVVLQDFSGAIRSFDRSDVRSVERDTLSLMPTYSKALTESEMNDLLTYLASLGKAEVKR